METDDKSSPKVSESLPILDYLPPHRRRTWRDLALIGLSWMVELAAIFAVIAVLLTIEMIFLIIVDLWTRRPVEMGEIQNLILFAASAAFLIVISIYVSRHRSKIV
jgi:hypothetical protein